MGRRFNRARYDAGQAVDLDSVRDDLAGVVQHALAPARISRMGQQALTT